MSAVWVLAVVCGLGAVVLLFPIVFSRDVKRARFLSYVFKIKYDQHLFPERASTPEFFSEWLPYQEQWTPLTMGNVGRRVLAIRQQTGGDPAAQLVALEQAGDLVQEIASEKSVRCVKREVKCDASDILAWYCERMDRSHAVVGTETEREGMIRSCLREHSPAVKEVVEVVLAAIEMLCAGLDEGKGVEKEGEEAAV